jgi:hypothetical protein
MRLPVELLTKILLCVVFDEAEDTALNWSSFSFSQTSYFLRQISLESPALWSRPIILAPALAEEMVRRSQGCLLSIIADLRVEHTQATGSNIAPVEDEFGGMMTPTWARSRRAAAPPQAILTSHNLRGRSFDGPDLPRIEAVLARIMCNQGDRLRSLFLTTTDSVTMGRLLRDFCSSAPALEALVLRRNKRVQPTFAGFQFGAPRVDENDGFAQLPLAFLDALPVSLRFLRLHCTAFDWTVFSRFQLVTLIVESVTNRATLR